MTIFFPKSLAIFFKLSYKNASVKFDVLLRRNGLFIFLLKGSAHKQKCYSEKEMYGCKTK